MECYRLFLETATAVGTIGATVLALWLALRHNQRHIDGTFIWEAATNFEPILLVQNTSNRIVVIDSIAVKYRNKRVSIINASDDTTLAKHAIIEAGQIKRIPINIVHLDVEDQKKPKKRYYLSVTITLRNGRRYTSKQKYSFDEMRGLFFGQALFEGE